MSQILVKIAASAALVLIATGVSKKAPSLAGLVGVMPLIGALVLLFVYYGNRGDSAAMRDYTRGALYGTLPSMLFYIVALYCFQRQCAIGTVLGASFGAWLVGALVHQWLLR